MKKLILVFLLASLAQAAYAIKIKTIYEAEVLVSSQEDQQKDRAIQQAFIQTLTKMSGSSAVLQNPLIKSALVKAKNMVEEFGYVPSGIPGTPYLLKVQFDPKAMKKLLREAREPIWDENRPLIMAWVTVENSGPSAEIIDNQSTNEYALLLKREAQQRGLPILLPIMDLGELNQISTVDIRTRAMETLQKATARYHTDGLLIGSIEPKGKTIQSQWRLILGPDHWDWDLSSETAPALIDLLSDKIVSALAGRYASIQTEEASSSLTLIVKGVAGHEDFENLMRFIKRMSLIKTVEIGDVSGDEVLLHLDVQGTQSAFMQEASIGQHLKLEIEKDKELTYLWVR